jgi:hypothetical protein
MKDRTQRHHERYSRSYDRQKNLRRPNISILIVCEGEKTEPNYFKSLRDFLKLPIINVDVVDKGGAPITVVEKAINLVEQRKIDHKRDKNISLYESVWCAFDIENPNNNSSLQKAIDKGLQNKIQLAISNPSFEYWYILHFEQTTRPFTDGKEAKQYLKRFIRDYDPAKIVFPSIFHRTKIALEFSKRSFISTPKKSGDFQNPSTYVHSIVQEMLGMSRLSAECFMDESLISS